MCIPPKNKSGFTLVELLIATGITAAIVVLLGTMLGSLMNTASHTTQRVDAFRDARAALQMMERDFSNLVRTQWNPDPLFSPNPAPCGASLSSPTSVTRPAAYFALKNIYNDPGAGNQQIYALISTKTAGSAQGDVCAVGYYCRWDDQAHAYNLRRSFRNSADTFTALQNAADFAADSDLYIPAATDAVLAADVWNFSVAVYDTAGTKYTTYPCVCDQGATTAALLPAAIEISFNAMSPQAARTVMSVSSTPADWMDATTQNYQRLIKPHAYQFRTRIIFQ
jgi:type II secretory pathway pseudopilin PulG